MFGILVEAATNWYRRVRNVLPSAALVALVVTLGVVALVPQAAYAGLITGLANLLASLILIVAGWFGALTLIVIGILVQVVQYNDFINAPAVIKGWVIVRDVCNMFFIVILLLLAFGTIFHIEEYQYKKSLGKLLIMAVLINFSKSIAGFFIDMAQVVMLTFVNGFKDAAAGNFANGFHLQEMFQLAEKSTTGADQGADDMALFYSAILAFITILITLVVVSVYLVVFLLRIVALWFLIIISPIAFLLSAFPGDAKKYSSQWWDYFGKYATTGPILAFFLWLSLAVMQMSSNAALGTFGPEFKKQFTDKSVVELPGVGVTALGKSEILLSFVINIILLMGGLWMTQQLGVAGGKLAGAAMNKIQNAPRAIGKGAFKGAAALGAMGARKLKARTGVDLNPVSVYKNLKAGFERKKKKEELQGIIASGTLLEKGGLRGAVGGLGAPGWVDNYARGFMYNKGLKSAVLGRPARFEKYKGKTKELEERSRVLTVPEKQAKRAELDGKLSSVYGREKSQTVDLQSLPSEQRSKLRTDLEAALPADTEINELRDKAQEAHRARDPIAGKRLEDQANALQGQQRAYRGTLASISKFDEMDQLGNDANKLNKQADAADAKGDNENAEQKREQARKLLQQQDAIKNSPLTSRMVKLDDRLKFTKGWKQDLQTERQSIEAEVSQLDLAPTITVAERAELQEQAGVARGKAEQAAALSPRDFIAEQVRRHQLEEESRKYPTHNEHELMSLERGAIARHEPMDAAAVAIQAARAYHLNEVIMDQKATSNYYYDSNKDEYNTEGRGELQLKEGQYLSASLLGLHAFVNEVFVKKLGMDKQFAINLESDLSEEAQHVNHWTYAQATSVNEDGTPRQRGLMEQNKAVKMERSKMDFEKRNREGNRLATSSEYWNDPYDKNSGRHSVLNPYFLVEMQESYPQMATLMGRDRFNVNAAQNIVNYNLDFVDEMARVTGIEKDPLFVKFKEETIKFAGKGISVDMEKRIKEMEKVLKLRLATGDSV